MNRRVLVILMIFAMRIAMPGRGESSHPYVPILPGSEIAVSRCLADPHVIVARASLINLGRPSIMDGPGRIGYHYATYKVTKMMKGLCKGKVNLSTIIKYSEQEENPILGMEYVVFIYVDEGGGKDAVKLLPADQVTVKIISDGIATGKK